MEQDVSYMRTGVYSKQTNLTQTATVSDSSTSINVALDLSPSQTTNAISLDPEDHYAKYGFEEELEPIIDEKESITQVTGINADVEDEEAKDPIGVLNKDDYTVTYDDGDYFVLGDDYVTKAQDEVIGTDSETIEEQRMNYHAPEETKDVESPAAPSDEQEYDGLETEVETPTLEEPDYEAIDVEAETPEETPTVTLEALIRTGIILH